MQQSAKQLTRLRNLDLSRRILMPFPLTATERYALGRARTRGISTHKGCLRAPAAPPLATRTQAPSHREHLDGPVTARHATRHYCSDCQRAQVWARCDLRPARAVTPNQQRRSSRAISRRSLKGRSWSQRRHGLRSSSGTTSNSMEPRRAPAWQNLLPVSLPALLPEFLPAARFRRRVQVKRRSLAPRSLVRQ